MVEIKPILTGPGRNSTFDAISEIWPAGRPDTADVVSPFFDPPEANNQPAQHVWQMLRQRGDAEVRYHVTAEDVPNSASVLVHAPKSLRDAQPPSRDVTTSFYRLPDEPLRPLHAKAVWLENDTWAGYLIGSSNFTSAGLGLAKYPNLEANLFYLMHRERNADGYKSVHLAFPKSQLIPNGAEQWQPLWNEDEPEQSVVTLPKAFTAAIFSSNDHGGHFVRLVFSEPPPIGWHLCVNETDETLLTESDWYERGSRLAVEIDWPVSKPAPYGLTVFWSGSQSGAWWPVNIESSAALPPPDELRELPLDVLIDVLTSGRPLHKVMRNWLKRRTKVGAGDNEIDIDPHKRVDSSAFLLQRTRRVSWLLQALRERLERPLATRESLTWRIDGPVGVQSVARALAHEADQRNSPEERCFLLCELALELSRVKPSVCSPSIALSDVKSEITASIQRIISQIDLRDIPESSNLRQYIGGVLQKIGGAP